MERCASVGSDGVPDFVLSFVTFVTSVPDLRGVRLLISVLSIVREICSHVERFAGPLGAAHEWDCTISRIRLPQW